MVTSFFLNLAIHRKEVTYQISLHDGTAEPYLVTPPQAVAYSSKLTRSWQLLRSRALASGSMIERTRPRNTRGRMLCVCRM
jgi:hypothetical protein